MAADPYHLVKMQFLLSLIICNILAVASCNLGFFKEQVTDVKIMEEFLEVVNSEKQKGVEKHENTCQNLYTVVHWAFWFESFVHDENTKEIDEKYSKEKCTKNCCQKLQNFLKEKVQDEREVEFKQFLENAIQYVENPGNTPFGEILEQFKVQKKFEIEIAEVIHSLKKLEEVKKKKFEKIKEKEKIKKLFDAENKKVEDFVGTTKENLRKMYSLFDSIRECENLIEKKGKEDFEETRHKLHTKIIQLNWSDRFNGKISLQLQTLKEAAREIHGTFSLEKNHAVDKKLDKKINSAREAVQKIEETIQTKRQILYGVHVDDDGTKYDSDEGLKSSAQFLLSDINDLVKLKKKMCDCPAKIVKEKKEFAKKREELGKEIHSFPVQLRKAEFYAECLPLQPEIENLLKMAVEEYNAGINLENEVFYESKKKVEEIFNNLLVVVKNAIASTFDHNCKFFEAAQKYLKKSILGTYLAIKQRKEMTSIMENLKEYSMEKYLLWREMYGSFGNCHIGKFEKVEENFKNKIQHLLAANHEEFEEFHSLITRSHRRELFKELGINQQNEIKIRMTDEHAHINIGDFDYDYRQYKPPRRLLFRYDIDAKTKEDSPRKAKPMKIPENQNGMKKYFTVEEADNVFFQLCKNGWYRENYNQERRRDCISFAHEFVCALHGHNCPPDKVWPENYVSVTEKWSYGSVFASDYGGAHRDFQEEFNKTNKFEKCTIEDFHFQFEIDTEVVDKKVLEKLLPVTIHYTTGKYSSTNWRNIVLEDLIEVQEFVQMDNEKTQEKIFYKTVLKAYACRVDFKLHAFIKNLKILKKDGKVTGYPLFNIDQLDLYEENKELLHFKLDKNILQMHIPREEETKETESTVV